MDEDKFSPTEKIKMAKEFLDTPFWRRVFEPYIKQMIQESMVSLINCSQEDLKSIQAAVKLCNHIDDFVEDYIEEAKVQIEMDRLEKPEPVSVSLDVNNIEVTAP